jgi:hypothetical protein
MITLDFGKIENRRVATFKIDTFNPNIKVCFQIREVQESETDYTYHVIAFVKDTESGETPFCKIYMIHHIYPINFDLERKRMFHANTFKAYLKKFEEGIRIEYSFLKDIFKKDGFSLNTIIKFN